MIQDDYNGNTGVIDVAGGKLILCRNAEDKITNYANGGVTGMSITAYGVSHGVTDSNYFRGL
jgi:hypothetical protein